MHLSLGLKDGAKVQGWGKTGSGFVSFRWSSGVRYGCVRGGIVAIKGRGKRQKGGMKGGKQGFLTHVRVVKMTV